MSELIVGAAVVGAVFLLFGGKHALASKEDFKPVVWPFHGQEKSRRSVPIAPNLTNASYRRLMQDGFRYRRPIIHRDEKILADATPKSKNTFTGD